MAAPVRGGMPVRISVPPALTHVIPRVSAPMWAVPEPVDWPQKPVTLPLPLTLTGTLVVEANAQAAVTGVVAPAGFAPGNHRPGFTFAVPTKAAAAVAALAGGAARPG